MKPIDASTSQLPTSSVFNPERWGLPREVTAELGNRLYNHWNRFHHCFTTLRHDTSENALTYLKGLLLLSCHRNYANIARKVISPDCDGQNLQQFMSDSPWASTAVFDQIQTEICEDKRLYGGLLNMDESGDVRSGDKSAGAARQYIGNVGKTEMGQVGVALGYYAANVWCMVDAELFLPKSWFDKEHKKRFRKLHIPDDRTFETKAEIGLKLIDRAIKNGLPFSRFACDTFYGQSFEFRAGLQKRGIAYLVDIPNDQSVYLKEPIVGIPPKGKMGRPPKRPKILNGVQPVLARDVVKQCEIEFETIDIRACERGRLCYDCASIMVWTVDAKTGQVRHERLFIHQESEGKITFSLSNEPEETPLSTLAQWRSGRYFVERTFQDAKSEAGWDELVAQKYRAWMHHTALDALALWFIAQTKLDWAEKYPHDPELVKKLQIDKLPALSMANIRLLLQAVMPLEQLTVDQAVNVVIKQMTNRAASTRSRLKKRKYTKPI